MPYSKLILHADTHWLSHGDVVTGVKKVFEEIKHTFLHMVLQQNFLNYFKMN